MTTVEDAMRILEDLEDEDKDIPRHIKEQVERVSRATYRKLRKDELGSPP